MSLPQFRLVDLQPKNCSLQDDEEEYFGEWLSQALLLLWGGYFGVGVCGGMGVALLLFFGGCFWWMGIALLLPSGGCSW